MPTQIDATKLAERLRQHWTEGSRRTLADLLAEAVKMLDVADDSLQLGTPYWDWLRRVEAATGGAE